MQAQLEHLNVTVPDAETTANWMCEVFGWNIRWKGEAIHGGRSVHVGSSGSYLAIYTPKEPLAEAGDTYRTTGALNHLGITVADLDAVEAKVKALGFKTYSHGDYEPGRRFYFRDDNGIEYECVEY